MGKHTGKCLCGDVTLQVTGAPVMQGNCHCTDCKKNTGAAYSTILFFKDEQVSFLSGETSSFQYTADSGKKPRSFAANAVRWFTELTQANPVSSQFTLVFLMTAVLPVHSLMYTPQGPCLLYQLMNHLTTLKKEGSRIRSAYTFCFMMVQIKKLRIIHKTDVSGSMFKLII